MKRSDPPCCGEESGERRGEGSRLAAACGDLAGTRARGAHALPRRDARCSDGSACVVWGASSIHVLSMRLHIHPPSSLERVRGAEGNQNIYRMYEELQFWDEELSNRCQHVKQITTNV